MNKDTNREAISAYLDLVRTFLLFTLPYRYMTTLEVRRDDMNGLLFQYEETRMGKAGQYSLSIKKDFI